MTAPKQKPPLGIQDVLALAKARETEVRLCLAGDMAPQAERLEAELAQLALFTPTSLADRDPRTELQAQLDALREKMRGSEVAFRFRALGKLAYSDLLAAHAPREGHDEIWNIETFSDALISASCIEPAMTVEQAGELSEILSQSQRNALFNTAWAAQVGETRVPTSRAASTSP